MLPPAMFAVTPPILDNYRARMRRVEPLARHIIAVGTGVENPPNLPNLASCPKTLKSMMCSCRMSLRTASTEQSCVVVDCDPKTYAIVVHRTLLQHYFVVRSSTGIGLCSTE